MSKKLLLADDSITIQKVIGITFAHEDYTLTIVDNGDAALTKARAERPDLILADVVMPGKNGYEVCSAIRQDSQLRHIPVLLLTGTFEPFDEGKAKAAGADSWIAKPFESQALIDRVEDLLARAAAAPPLPEPAAAGPLEVAVPADADSWDELQALNEADDVEMAEAKEDLWSEPGAADDFWGTVSAEAAEEIEAPAEDDWSGLAAEVDNAVGGTQPDQRREGPIGEGSTPLDDMFILEEAPVAAVDDHSRFEELSKQENSFAFEEIPAEEEEPSSFLPLTEPVAQTDSQWSDTATEWAGFEEEILPLDESDIIEEEDLDVGVSPPSFSAGEAYGLAANEDAFDEELPQPQSDEFVFGDAPAASAARSDQEFLFEEEGFALGGELPPLDESEWGLPIQEENLSHPIDRSEAEVSELSFGAGGKTAGASRAPAAAGVMPAAASVEEKIAALSDEEIGRIVEKVAGPVIERLAQTLLEKVAWEVVPDMAESMIRDEIRKIRESAAR